MNDLGVLIVSFWVFMTLVCISIDRVTKHVKRVADELAYPRERREELLSNLNSLRLVVEAGCADPEDFAKADAIREELAALGGREPR